jgi:spermidine synthase
MEQRLDRADHRDVAQSLAEVGFESVTDLLVTYAGQASDLAPWLEGAQINHDRNLRLQYMAGMGLNQYQGASISDEMLKYWTFPEKLFVGSPRKRLVLRQALGRAGRR